MPDARQVLATPLPPDYDPARAARIQELIEAMRATDDPKEIGRLESELHVFMFGPPC